MSGSATTLRIEEYDWDKARKRFTDQWHSLLVSGDFHLSLSPEWVNAIASSRNVTSRLRVLVAQRDGKVLGLLPYYVGRIRIFGVPITVVEPAGNLLSYHQEIVAAQCQLELLQACLGDAKREWHLFVAAGLQPDGPTAQALRAVQRELGSTLLRYPVESSPYLPINVTWEQFMASKSRKFRYNRQREERALRKAGDLEVRWLNSPEGVSELYECMMEIESHSWKTGAGIAVSTRAHEQRYYQVLLPFLAERKALMSNVLFLNKNPIAYLLCYFWNGKIGNLKTTFHEAYHSLSPGSVAIQIAIQKAFELGAKEFDFLGDAQYHKLLWTDLVRRRESYYLFSRHLRSCSIGLIKKIVQSLRPREWRRILRRSEIQAR